MRCPLICANQGRPTILLLRASARRCAFSIAAIAAPATLRSSSSSGTAKDWRDLDRLAFEQRQRVHLEVVENFTGADAGEFTLYTESQGCGFDFAEGETYLVDTHMKVATGTWEASSCSRTRLLAQATEDFEALHSWKTGQRLPGRISGFLPLQGRHPPMKPDV